jgi:hypothetical protein
MVFDFRQRYEDVQETLRTTLDGRQVDIWTALPGIIQSFDPVALTVTVQPAIQALYTGADLSQKFVNLPILPDVPVVFPRGGKYTLTFPITVGDECLVVFSSRCIDNWWDQGGVQSQYELRMHDLSDGFALVGPFSQKTKITNISTNTTQLRSNDGTVSIDVDATGKITLTAPTQVTINSPLTVCEGDLHVTGAIVAGAGGADQVTLQQHRHGITGGVASATITPTPGT